ncbi:MAG: glycoside hydrolase [Pseudopedobacter saltans]|uniref:chitinase n=1 Tax=Pseudopedobacter saltans TaxID=151895 RepID=A0A2W5F1K8_9SPHI|nr:MAG: glycoside hydrolase [Pseudopedobacter saltans]
MSAKLFAIFTAIIITSTTIAQKKRPLVIAYYTGDSSLINQYNIGQLDQIIYSFAHLRNDSITLSKAKDSITLHHLASLKKQYPRLKILLSMGGWSGCAPCSETFSRENGRKTFAITTQKMLKYFDVDGLDLDWEYPTIEGYPGHLYQASDKTNFTELIKTLRKTLGKKYELSFAAGGFQHYLDSAVEWKKIMPLLDRVNIMSYDLVSGYATVTGHHTPLYSTNRKEESTDKAVQYLLKLGIPPKKLVIGGAFYSRIWKNVAPINNGLYQTGAHTKGVDFRKYDSAFTTKNGWQYFWDEKAQAPYWYNAKDSSFATGDDIRSIKAKTQYVLDNRLGGIMFWELPLDLPRNGMVQAITDVMDKNHR